jgi:hypothetical protein
MQRLVPLAALLASACGSATDDRPPTLEYITETILAPSCAAAQCHSPFKAQVGDVFDTPEATRRTIVANGLVFVEDRDAPEASYLIRSLTVGTDSLLDPGSGTVRMPYDAPMPDADIELIKRWIEAGIPGAQCVPNDQNLGCQVHTVAGQQLPVYDVVECPDGNAGAIVQTCTTPEICSYDTGNGQCVTP